MARRPRNTVQEANAMRGGQSTGISAADYNAMQRDIFRKHKATLDSSFANAYAQYAATVDRISRAAQSELDALARTHGKRAPKVKTLGSKSLPRSRVRGIYDFTA